MDTQLSRVQVYLDPNDVTHLDTLAYTIKIKRSQIIRDAVLGVGLRYNQIVALLNKKSAKNPMMDYCGIEDSKTGHVSENIDEIYQTT